MPIAGTVSRITPLPAEPVGKPAGGLNASAARQDVRQHAGREARRLSPLLDFLPARGVHVHGVAGGRFEHDRDSLVWVEPEAPVLKGLAVLFHDGQGG